MGEPTTTAAAVAASAVLGPAGGALAAAAIAASVWYLHRRMAAEKPGVEQTSEVTFPHGTVRLKAKSKAESIEITAFENCSITLPRFVFENQQYTDRAIKAIEAFAVVAVVAGGAQSTQSAHQTYISEGDKLTSIVKYQSQNPLDVINDKFANIKRVEPDLEGAKTPSDQTQS